MRHRLGLAAAAALFATGAAAQNFDNATIRTTDLGNRLYMFEAFDGEEMLGGNMMIAAGGDAIILVDSNFAPLHEKTVAAIRAISDLPVRYLVNTHHHNDHTGGNAAFGREGVTIVSQARMRQLMVLGTRNGLTDVQTGPAEAAALPGETYTGTMILRVGGQTASLVHVPGTHTGGDTFVYFSNGDVLVTGDIVAFNRYPNVDYTTGGHIDRMIAGVDRFIAMADEDTKIVPGHGPLGTRADLIEYREMMAQSRERVLALMAEGKSEDEIVALKPTADFDAKLHMDEPRTSNWIRVIYRSYRPQ